MSEYLRHLPDYRRNCIQRVEQSGNNQIAISAVIPRSVSCLGLQHASPTDATLAMMQAAYITAGYSIENLPENFQYNGLFLGHQAQYVNQDASRVRWVCKTKSIVHSPIEAVRISIEDRTTVTVQLLGGIPQQEPKVYLETHNPEGIPISTALLEETLNIYTGEIQSQVMALGYNPNTDIYEAAIHFPKYSEIHDLEHVSAKQMIEGIMKAAYCAAAHKAYMGVFVMDYKKFLSRRLEFRTASQNIKYRKLLAFGSQSLLHFQFATKGKTGVFILSNPENMSDDEQPFATGSITFYLP